MTGHAPGDRFDHLELEELLGTGGFAEVWRARHHGSLGFTRQVAVKLLRPEREDDAGVSKDLITEASICAELLHDHIVQVHAVSEVRGTLVVEMDLVGGGTVHELIETLFEHGQRLPASAVLAIGAQVCAGLDHAWNGLRRDGRPFHVVHRDLKPQNLLLTEQGKVRIADFGLAKRTDDTTATATAVGSFKGTPRYIAPETMLGDKPPPSPAIDLFALGCVLFEAWTGRPLHDGDTLPAVVTQVIMGDPTQQVAPLRREFPELADLVEQLLVRDPAVRPSDPAAVGARLAALRAARHKDPGLSTLMELVRCMKSGERSAHKELGTDDVAWMALWRRVQHAGSKATTVIASASIEEPAIAEPAMVFDEATRELPATAEPVPRKTAPRRPAPRPARASVRRSPPRSGAPLVLGLVAVVLMLLIGIVALLPSRGPEAAVASPDQACLLLGSSPSGADVWIDGAPVAEAGDHKGLARWHAPGPALVAMGIGGVALVETTVELPARGAVRVVCSTGASPACLVAKMESAPCR